MANLLFIQHGDYAEAWRRFARGEAETFREQKASVDLVAGLAADFRVTTLAICDRPHREELAPGLLSMGIAPSTAFDKRRILALLSEIAPDRLILRSPHRLALAWARWKAIPTLPVFADIFATTGLRQRLLRPSLIWSLSGPHLPCIANHSLNATLSLQRDLGLPASRLVPWDRAPLTPDAEPKSPRPASDPFHAIFVGTISTAKGVGDCLTALALLRDRGCVVTLDLAGDGDLDTWRQCAADLGLAGQVRFLGRRPNAEIRSRMRAADVVLVASRHDYAEGLPNTLCEGLASRTPILLSDHPAFASRLQHDRDGLIFRAADPESLAAALLRLRSSPELQRRLSLHAPQALASLRFGMDWGALILQYLEDPTDRQGWVARNSLETLLARTSATR